MGIRAAYDQDVSLVGAYVISERQASATPGWRGTPAMANGTAVNICTMVFGNRGDDSGTGVGFTRDPGTGENVLYGEYLVNA